MHAASERIATWWKNHPTHPSYKESLNADHRLVIRNVVGRLQALSVFEVGVHCGANLIGLIKQGRTMSCAGIDVNEQSVALGRKWIESLGFSDSIRLDLGIIPDDLSRYGDDEFDVALSCYSLCCSSPADIDICLDHMARIATTGVIIVEPMMYVKEARMHDDFDYEHWSYNYIHRMSRLKRYTPLKLSMMQLENRNGSPFGLVVAENADVFASKMSLFEAERV